MLLMWMMLMFGLRPGPIVEVRCTNVWPAVHCAPVIVSPTIPGPLVDRGPAPTVPSAPADPRLARR